MATMDTKADYTFLLAQQKMEHMLLVKDTLQQSSFPLSKYCYLKQWKMHFLYLHLLEHNSLENGLSQQFRISIF